LGSALILYLGLAGAFALWKAIQCHSLHLWPGIVLSFLALHAAWGLGFWTGVLDLLGKRLRRKT
jgi:hypothetical protein